MEPYQKGPSHPRRKAIRSFVAQCYKVILIPPYPGLDIRILQQELFMFRDVEDMSDIAHIPRRRLGKRLEFSKPNQRLI